MTPRTKQAPVVKTNDMFEAAVLRMMSVPFDRFENTTFFFFDEDGEAEKVLEDHRNKRMQLNTGDLNDSFLWVKEQIINSPTVMTGKKKQ